MEELDVRSSRSILLKTFGDIVASPMVASKGSQITKSTWKEFRNVQFLQSFCESKKQVLYTLLLVKT